MYLLFLSGVVPEGCCFQVNPEFITNLITPTHAFAAARKLPVAVAVAGRLGAPLTLTISDGEGRRGAAESEVPLQVRLPVD